MSRRLQVNRTLFGFIPIAIAAILISQAGPAHAGAIGDPNAGNSWSTTSAVSIVAHSGEAGQREIVHMIDGTGISGVDGEFHAGGTPLGTMALFRNLDGAGAPNPGYAGSAQPGTAVGSHWVEFTFDQTYNLGETWLWNWNETPYNNFGWRFLNVQYSVDGVNFNTAFAGELPIAPGADGATPQLILNFGGAPAKYVVLTNTGFGVDSNWGAAAQLGDDFDAGLSEVRFFTQVPEPATGVLLLVGFTLLSAMVRMRQRGRG